MSGSSLEGFRLSPQQKRLWQLQQASSSQHYRASCAVLIEGNLNTTALESALKNVVNRYEILRTNFRVLPGMMIPLQVITSNNTLTVTHHNLMGIDSELQETKLELLFS
jgi:hypothetical protein